MFTIDYSRCIWFYNGGNILRQCVLRGGLPFSVELPQYKPEVVEAMEEARRISKDTREKRYDSFSEVMENMDWRKGLYDSLW